MNNIKIIITLGPSTRTEADLRKIKDKGVDFVRVNMSHSSIEDLQYFIALSKKVGIPFIVDTEGSQIRTGDLSVNCVSLKKNDSIKIYKKQIMGNERKISLKPGHIADQLSEGDLIDVDFDDLILKVSDISTISEGYITAKAITSGTLGRKKAVVINSVSKKMFKLPPLSEKDYKSIEIGLKEGIEYIAASFMRSGEFVGEVRKATNNSMKIISKIECIDALKNLDEIIKKSDFILIDRGDLSKEIPIEKIPFAQKIILKKASDFCKGVFVATNLLETMVEKNRPTRAEVHDVVTTILNGAAGVTLSAETAIGKYPMECIDMINKLIKQTDLVNNKKSFQKADIELAQHLENLNYFFR